MTNREAIARLTESIKRAERDCRPYASFVEIELLTMAIEALRKVEAYETFIEDFVFEGGYGDYSAMCEYMTWHNDTWCSEHCAADKPDLECVVKWSEERGE